MSSDSPSDIRSRLAALARTPFATLFGIFLGRMFHGSGSGDSNDADDGQLSLGVGVVSILLLMPGLLVSLLMFEKYGSLVRYLRGELDFDPFVATIPDEYFFIILSVVVTGVAALWRWDAIFLDRRDYTNLVPLPISLSTIFAANFCAILAFVTFLTIVVNVASLVFFPVAVVGSQSYFSVWFRFAAGHAAAVFLASAFSFFAVFAVVGTLMAALPSSAFRRVSLIIRFVMGVVLLLLLATVLAVPDLLDQSKPSQIQTLIRLPPISFLGIASTVWGRGQEPRIAAIAYAALLALTVAIVVATIGCAISFRRTFLRIPETNDTSPIPQLRLSLPSVAPIEKLFLRNPSQRGCFRFAIKTLLRSEQHLQIVLAFAALALVAAAESLNSAQGLHALLSQSHAPVEFLAVPFVASYCLLVGIRFAFEMPADLRANWIFRMWIAPDSQDARPLARRVLHTLTLTWLAPFTFFFTLHFFGWRDATLHTVILVASTTLLAECLLVNFRKIPFTCAYPQFESKSGLVLVAYLFGFFLFTDDIPAIENWVLADPIRILVFIPILAAGFAVIQFRRRQLLDMDKTLIFSES